MPKSETVQTPSLFESRTASLRSVKEAPISCSVDPLKLCNSNFHPPVTSSLRMGLSLKSITRFTRILFLTKTALHDLQQPKDTLLK
jgi:hypothetical protein